MGDAFCEAGGDLGHSADAGAGVLRGPLSDSWCENETTRQSAAFIAANSAGYLSREQGRRSLHLWGAPAVLGDSQDEGAGFLEPTEGLKKPTGVLTLPGQSFDGLDDLVMQIAESEGVKGCSDREETELEQWALHLGVPGTVGTILRPLEPKHAA